MKVICCLHDGGRVLSIPFERKGGKKKKKKRILLLFKWRVKNATLHVVPVELTLMVNFKHGLISTLPGDV